ncbi:hypothetical protein Tsubulata_044949 [Turnera subulata]|uniref:Uncharacterized protein n=1 Tax=Turnera subulata TaxID=218843 RepID=A0A9Q0F400_9ROSI|nr:hypothetical protein Tsubulata_044949 [Turnera subulata]
MIPKQLQPLFTASAIVMGSLLAINITSTITLGALRFVGERRQRKVALPCAACRGKGFYVCKLCKGNSTIPWPLYDPVAVDRCLCPTCDGKRVQRCLNCIGKGYA